MRPHIEAILAIVRHRLASRKGQAGQTLVEYALIMAMVSVVMVGTFFLLRTRIQLIFSAITTLLDTAQSSH